VPRSLRALLLLVLVLLAGCARPAGDGPAYGRLVTIDAKQVQLDLQATGRTTLPFGFHDYAIDAAPYSVKSPDYSCQAVGPNGTQEPCPPEPPSSMWKGHLVDAPSNTTVVLTVQPDPPLVSALLIAPWGTYTIQQWPPTGEPSGREWTYGCDSAPADACSVHE